MVDVSAASASEASTASAEGVLPSGLQVAPVKSAMRCYATRADPEAVVCYRFSKKAEFRHGSIVYVPILIQVPTPSNPPSVVIVNSLDDVHPGDTSG
jgi:hypothetical protein